mmetsp:Transcript_14946/g.32985  ORF Transcript_14946/g.32985 Transcript_14946/m.32985 type:complete len:141 (-) Transcript_14946:107-529(-)
MIPKLPSHSTDGMVEFERHLATGMEAKLCEAGKVTRTEDRVITSIRRRMMRRTQEKRKKEIKRADRKDGSQVDVVESWCFDDTGHLPSPARTTKFVAICVALGRSFQTCAPAIHHQRMKRTGDKRGSRGCRRSETEWLVQ